MELLANERTKLLTANGGTRGDNFVPPLPENYMQHAYDLHG